MDVSIIVTGSEILYGKVQDTNSKFLAQKLTDIGLNIKNIIVCSDEKSDIKEKLNFAAKNTDLIFITGGLGPTKDDLTRDALAEAADLKLKFSDRLAERLHSFFENSSSKMTKNNLKQAYLPENAEAVLNDNGTAPGIKLNHNNKTFYLMPGVPSEMRSMFLEQIYPDLKKINNNSIFFKEYNFIGIGESTLADKIEKLTIPENAVLSYQAGRGEVKLRLKVENDDAESTIEFFDNLISTKFTDYFYGTGDMSLLEIFCDRLKKSGLTIATAESFTGGLLGKRLTELEGSSAYFKGGIIAYSSKAKKNILKINPNILEKYGAVSHETALAMAGNIADIFAADIGVSTTGVAGPDSMEGKKAGTMFVGIKYFSRLFSFKLNKNYNRKLNRWYATQIILFKIMKLLENY
ncbi:MULTISPECIES: competence/damage-inducible protein A [unclassified Halanaerobium]|uniref:competence/damage-inducible protein A n=1 Tax=unclassified Halanaerobium TaxID=2641197 RepID=UPI000DF33DF4|nr:MULTISPECIES: competence/damage-inducible protein A [unclassified Halanaerobium]RCW51516.1 competence/damage-inducible protein cinA [Halanaerobium sp. MA284_MarDTE_T2]RCW89304.1 competence/damage-inducible protein cinA [Halanaerobium sp. DL-01]